MLTWDLFFILVGVAVFSNEENYGTQVLNVVLWKIIDHVLGLEPIDWNER
jgi:hypothetical protein